MAFSSSTVKASLSSHSLIGVTTGILLYIICLTGTILVAAHYFERWQQPAVAEYSNYSYATVNTAIDAFYTQTQSTPESLYVVLPTESLPRIHVAGGQHEFFVKEDGTLDEAVKEGWISTVRDMHYYLLLPHTVGGIIVGLLGALMLGLCVSGIVAHPRIFVDAFRLRWNAHQRLAQADLHNRLSVWALPFHVMISVTGAFFGLVSILVLVATSTLYDGTPAELTAEIYGADPTINAPVQEANINKALTYIRQKYPQATPLYIVIQQPKTPQQFIEIAATMQGRLSYSEIFRFNTQGDYLNTQGLTNGPLPRQILYSTYRLHFGQYGGNWVLIGYVLLGLASTLVTATGINIWLARRKKHDIINPLWVAAVWGLPLSLALSALGSLFMLPVLACFFMSWAWVTGLCIWQQHQAYVPTLLRTACAAVLIFIPFVFFVLHPDALQSVFYNVFNAAIAGVGLLIAVPLIYRRFTNAKHDNPSSVAEH
ncbi:PepSY-associated TM helix domain-containing protein [Marinagarivorans algicola]|uniref:PepSY-associated TM helix domain-containing protein n=1 Tax=Marinagarivorans algicola TaxID=1513270 RepID=UPI0006B9BD0F|nr:PepSY-associated TM helix domain-containing protein [Marinagarivorans algicola]